MKLSHFITSSFSLSPLRTYQHFYCSTVELNGKVLDLGGAGKTSYSQLFKGNYSFVTINIDPATNPTIVGDITKHFPLKDKEFDAVVSMNTFEHIFDFDTPLKESYRVMKSRAIFVGSTPYLHQIHSSPNDYWRYSGSCLEDLFNKHGFDVKKIIPLGTGLFVARYSLMYGALPRIIRPFFAACAWILDTMLCKLSSRYRKSCSEQNYPLGYFFIAEKP